MDFSILSTLLWIFIIFSVLSPIIQRQTTTYRRLRAIRHLEEQRNSRVITKSLSKLTKPKSLSNTGSVMVSSLPLPSADPGRALIQRASERGFFSETGLRQMISEPR